MMLLDNFLVATPFRLTDMWIAELYSLVYLCFNIVWYYFGEPNGGVIYSILDWNNDPLTAALYILLVFFVMIPIFSFIHYMVFRMREFLHSTCRNQVALGNLGDRLLPERDSSSDLPPPTVPTAPPAPDDSLPLNRNPLHMSDAGQDEHVGNGMVERAGSDTV